MPRSAETLTKGAAYVFTEPGSGWANMTQAAKLTASDGAADDQFGQSAAVSGNTVVVGAICATVGGNADQGAAYVFTSGLTLSPTTLPVGTENMAYNQTITASGEGTDPITMTVSDIEVNGVAGPGISGLTMVDNGNGSLFDRRHTHGRRHRDLHRHRHRHRHG